MTADKTGTLVRATVRVCVTRADILRGHPEDDCACPVSRAIRRAVGIPTSVSAVVAVVDYATPWQTAVWLPDEVAAFVEAFDAGESVEPFEFDLSFDLQSHLSRRDAVFGGVGR